MPPRLSTDVHLASRPHGLPTPDDFAIVATDVPAPAEGEVLVRNLFMSVDPYMRYRMNDLGTGGGYRIGRPLDGGAVGEVLETRDPAFRVGDTVTSNRGWRECFVAPGRELRVVDPRVQPLSAYWAS